MTKRKNLIGLVWKVISYFSEQNTRKKKILKPLQ